MLTLECADRGVAFDWPWKVSLVIESASDVKFGTVGVRVQARTVRFFKAEVVCCIYYAMRALLLP